MRRASLRLAFVLLVVAMAAPAAKADVVYTLSASDTVIGNFSWSFSEPSIITATSTNITSFLSTSAPSGCTLTGATITMNYLSSGDPYIETFFGGTCSYGEVAQEFYGAGSLSSPGTYSPAGLTSEDWTLTITETPEPSSLFLLGFSLPAMAALILRRKHHA